MTKPIIQSLKLSAVLLLFTPLASANSGYKKVASYTTSIAGQSENVIKNIRIACDKINSTVVAQKSTFSFNSVVGAGSAKNGFLSGRALYRDFTRMEPGGGICQVSSTLFNAFLLSGSIIIERHRHFQPVTYVPPGLDATIKYGKKDLKIKNPYSQPLMIRASTTERSLTISIYSTAPLPYRYEIETEVEYLPIPFQKQNTRLRPGIAVSVFRKRYSATHFIESALLYKDYYPPAYFK